MVIDKSSPAALYDYFMQTPEMQQQANLMPADRNSVYKVLYKLANSDMPRDKRAAMMLKFMANNATRQLDAPPADIKLSAPLYNEFARGVQNQDKIRFNVDGRTPAQDFIPYTPESTDLVDEKGNRQATIYSPSVASRKFFESLSAADTEFPDPARWSKWALDKLAWLKSGKHVDPQYFGDVTTPYFETPEGKVYANPIGESDEARLPKQIIGADKFEPKFDALPDVDTSVKIPDDFKATPVKSHPLDIKSSRYESAVKNLARGRELYKQYLETNESPESERDNRLLDNYAELQTQAMLHVNKVIQDHISKLEDEYDKAESTPARGSFQKIAAIRRKLYWWYLVQDRDDATAKRYYPLMRIPSDFYDRCIDNVIARWLRKKYGVITGVYNSKEKASGLTRAERALKEARELGSLSPKVFEAYDKLQKARYKEAEKQGRAKVMETLSKYK